MQNKEKTVKKRGRPGLTDKRFWMKNGHKDAVEKYRTILEIKRGYSQEIAWETALEHLIETHPATKKLLPLS